MSRITSLIVTAAIASGCRGDDGGGSGGGWVFTATLTVNGQGAQALDLSAGASLYIGSDRAGPSAKDDASPCDYYIGFSVPSPLATQVYTLGGETSNGSFAVYSDACNTGNVDFPSTTGDLTVTRLDGSCAMPPCIEATFGFSVSEPTSPTSSRIIAINNGHISNY